MQNSGLLFEEKQYFRHPIIWLLLVAVNALNIYFLINSYRKSGGSEFAGFLIPAVLVAVITALIYIIRLETEIRSDGIYYRFYPFHTKFRKIGIGQVSKIYVRKYKPIAEYGGWGYRLGIFGAGRALNVSGNMGIQIVYDDHKKLLLGTKKPDEATIAISLLPSS